MLIWHTKNATLIDWYVTARCNEDF